MNSLDLAYIAELDTLGIEDAADILKSCAHKRHAIDRVNWPADYPYKPKADFAIGRSKESLFIHFAVTEEYAHAQYTQDQDPVWQDSCVEFFCRLPEQNFYRHFEFNCIGTCLAYARQSREEGLRPYPESQLKQIERFASLGKKPLSEMPQATQWELCVKIPFALLDIDCEKLPEELYANFYKCADASKKPHYLSWNPIDTEKPDFHRLDFFGTIRL